MNRGLGLNRLVFLGVTLAVLSISSVLVIRSFSTTIWDDPYITFRYAKNLAEGHGFVFNIGEKVLGTSAPLWTLILALAGLSKLVPIVDLPTFARMLSVCFYGLVGLALFVLAYDWLCRFVKVKQMGTIALLALLCTAIWLLSPSSLDAATSGMETTFFTFLLVLAAYCYSRQWNRSAAVVLALLLVTRVDGFVVIACYGLALLIFRRKAFLPFCCVMMLVSLPWFIFSYYYFGSAIPNTILAKLTLFSNSEWTWSRIQVVRALLGGKFGIMLWALLFFALYSFKWRVHYSQIKDSEVMTDACYIPFALYAVAYAAYLVVFVPRPQPWYFIPFIPSVALGAVIGIAAISSASSNTIMHRKMDASRVVMFGLLSLVVIGIGIRSAKVVKIVFKQNTIPFTEGLSKIGKFLDVYPSDSIVFAGDIGQLGWFSGLRVYDFAGLVTPDAIAYNRERQSYQGRLNIKADNVLRQIEDVKPDFIVLATYMPFTDTVSNASYFRKYYRELLRTEMHTLYEVTPIENQFAGQERLAKRCMRHFEAFFRSPLVAF